MTDYPLEATTAVKARAEIKRRWPGRDVNYTGYDKKGGEDVFMSLVRGATTGNVATLKRNRAPSPKYFIAHVPE